MTFISHAFKIRVRGFSEVRGIKYRVGEERSKEGMFLLMGGVRNERDKVS